MEHIVQFAVGIDDNAITEKIEEYAKKEITKNLQKQVEGKLFQGRYSFGQIETNPEYDPLSEFSQGIICDMLEKNKEIIINKAAELLAAKLVRTKAAKAILGDIEEANNAEIH